MVMDHRHGILSARPGLKTVDCYSSTQSQGSTQWGSVFSNASNAFGILIAYCHAGNLVSHREPSVAQGT